MPSSPILSLLSAHLPYSLPLYRRIQFLEIHPSEHARITTVPPLSEIPLPPDSSSESLSKTPPWVAACVDLMRGPETQIWIFSSIEIPDIETTNPLPRNDERSFRECVREQLLEVFSIIYHELVPKLPEAAPENYSIMRMGKPLPYSRSRVIIGTLHKILRAMVPAQTIARVDAPHLKYIFSLSSFSAPVALPPGFEFCSLQRSHLETVLSRTHIPRSIPTLMKMHGLGIVETSRSNPIAWGFLGFDGSLSTLHTEPEHRGKGLAVQLARHLFQGQDTVFSADTDWAHADVEENNVESRRVMEKIGGKVVWENCWVEVELENLFRDGD